MTRKLLDDYLDGDLAPDQRAELERRLLADPSAARLLAQLKSERALRAAAIASFEPAPQEARALAAETLRAIHDSATHGSRPAGYVGIWVRRCAAIAAGLAIVAGSFALGRISNAHPQSPLATKTPAANAESQVVYSVVYLTDNGEKQVREFASLDDQNAFINKVDLTRAQPQVAAVADLSSPGSF